MLSRSHQLGMENPNPKFNGRKIYCPSKDTFTIIQISKKKKEIHFTLTKKQLLTIHGKLNDYYSFLYVIKKKVPNFLFLEEVINVACIFIKTFVINHKI